jgi:uncharacterized protein YdaL
VIVNVLHQNKLIKTLQEDTSKGMATFEFSEDFYKEKNYHFEITTLGITQKTITLNYGN